MKVVINGCFGGFGLSEKAEALYAERIGTDVESVDFYNIERNDPVLVAIVEELGQKAGGWCSRLRVVEVPDDVQWHIAEYDGNEWVAENHRTWQ